MARQLNPQEITQAVANLGDGWRLDQDRLVKTFQLQSFRESLTFVMNIAERAEEMNHHPEISIRFTTVEILLITHSAQAITDLDIAFAERVDRIYTTMLEAEAHPRH